MNMNSRKLIVVLATLLVVSICACVAFSVLPGSNYTEDYRIYCNVKNITETNSLLDYCHSNNVEYEIKNGCFSMEKYDVQFSIEKALCSIQPASHCSKLALLANDEYRFVTVTARQSKDNKLVQTLSYKTLTHRYELCEGKYRVITAWPAYVAFLCAVVFCLSLVGYVKYCMACKRAYLENHTPNTD